jgi:predicted DNA-binding protein with PD1-like motif
MFSGRYNDVLAVRLDVGEPVHESLLAECKRRNIKGAMIVSGIGMLADPELAFFVGNGRYDTQVFAGKFELLCLSGNVSVRDDGLLAHIHVILGRPDYSVLGGHLMQATVGLTLEVGLLPVEGSVRMYRKIEEQWGLPGLYVDEDGPDSR